MHTWIITGGRCYDHGDHGLRDWLGYTNYQTVLSQRGGFSHRMKPFLAIKMLIGNLGNTRVLGCIRTGGG